MSVSERIVACRACPRLAEHCREVARVKRRAYRDEDYWGKPVPTFGGPQPRLLVVGLAPGAHGANRTGRVFTGDASGEWLYRALHLHGFANRAESVRDGDGLRLIGAAINNVLRCAPPQNKPTREELVRCRPFLEAEIASYRRLRVVLALGKIAFDGFLKAWAALDREPFQEKPAFAHGGRFTSGRITLLASYHPSRQNTNTGRLTRPMFDGTFALARALVDAGS
ncbi:MAG: uracil-DNA glycosylase [Planctomycetota bacterium]